MVATSDTESAIVAACARILSRHGYRKLSMEDVAREAGLTRRTLYAYFADKEALVRATVQGAVAAPKAAMREALTQDKPALDLLHDVVMARITARLCAGADLLDTSEDLRRLLFPADKLSELLLPEREIVAQALQLCMDERSLPTLPVADTAALLVRATNGYMPAALEESEKQDLPSVRRRLSILVSLLIRGLEFSSPSEMS
jgi:AcrR family transcriptional regulator